MEICAVEREAGSDSVPQLREIDVDEQPAAVVADALPRDHESSLRDRLLEAERPQRAAGVPGQVDTRPRLAPGVLPLDDLDREAGTASARAAARPASRPRRREFVPPSSLLTRT